MELPLLPDGALVYNLSMFKPILRDLLTRLKATAKIFRSKSRPMPQVASAEFQSFLDEKPFAVVHFDAAWDSGREVTRRRMREAEQEFGARVTFAEVDCDKEIELAKSIPVMNVPMVAYYRNSVLVAALIGADQKVRARVERLLQGAPIGYRDGTEND
jgi:thioredoxin-like negative regulator of GroEL